MSNETELQLTPNVQLRPDILNDKKVEQAAFSDIADQILKIDPEYGADGRDRLIEELAEAFEPDGYDFMRNLESNFGWSGSAALVETLDGASRFVRKAEEKAASEWVKANNLTCPFVLGQAVTAKVKWRPPVEGVVTNIYEDEYKVTIGQSYIPGKFNGGQIFPIEYVTATPIQ